MAHITMLNTEDRVYEEGVGFRANFHVEAPTSMVAYLCVQATLDAWCENGDIACALGIGDIVSFPHKGHVRYSVLADCVVSPT